MKYQKGESGNKSGRPQGAKDKIQTDIKQSFQSLVEGNLINIETWLSKVADKDPAKALDFILKLSEFILPKIKSVELKTDFEDKRPMFIFRSVAGMTPEEIANLKD